MDECQNVIAFTDLEATTDDATTTTSTTALASNSSDCCMNMGQSESKKLAKRSAASTAAASSAQPETKGTAMSFGFKKKLLPSKKAAAASAAAEHQTGGGDDGGGGGGGGGDDNGNTEAAAAGGAEARDSGRTTLRLTPPRKESNGGPYRSIRFGFRQANTVRPASVGLNPSYAISANTNCENTANNNVTVKPRSKSASNTGRSVAPNGPKQTAAHGANKSLTPPPLMPVAADKSSSSLATATSPSSSASLQPLGPYAAAAAATSASSSAAARSVMHPKISGPVSTTVNISYQQQQQQQPQQPPQPPLLRPIKSCGPLEMSQQSTSGHQSTKTTLDCGTNKPPSGKQQSQQPQPAHPKQHMYTNDIIRPIPKPASATTVSALVSKFTLHTSSLPQPQYPVAINLASTTPSPVEPLPPMSYPSLSTAAAYHPAVYTSPTVAAAMDTKYAKQTANANRRYGSAAGSGFRMPREISSDSGIANMSTGSQGNNYYGTSSTEHSSSMDSPTSSAANLQGNSASATRRCTGGRPRNLEMVMSSRHKFDVRELDDSMSDESPLALALPKLPSSFGSAACAQQPASLSGLTRQQQQQSPNAVPAATVGPASTGTYRKTSFTSLMDVDSSIEEEKEFRDKSTSEKGTRLASAVGAAGAAAKEYSPCSKNSSPISSRASWCNAGESMAVKDCSSMSVSSCDSINNRDVPARAFSLDDQDDVDQCSSAVLISGDMLSNSISFATKSNLSDHQPPNNQAQNDQSAANINSKSEQALTVDIGRKFAQITASVDEMFLDDETSPTDSLVSSTDSDEIISKRNKKKINDAIKGLDIDDGAAAGSASGMDVTSPLLLSPCSPTHASHSLSLSDEGRDFLIDDEIADQPALCFSKSHELAASIQHLNSLTETPTLIETTTSTGHKSGRSKRLSGHKNHETANDAPNRNTPLSCNPNSYAPQAKPRHSLLSRTESLDTMSSCESIASDDMMMDFDSSADSIDMMCQSVHGGSTSALHSMAEAQLWSEWESQAAGGGLGMMHEWSTMLRGPKPNNGRDSVMSTLPARATRLLNRSRLLPSGGAGCISLKSANSQHGSDSPRSLDSFSRRTSSHRSVAGGGGCHLLDSLGGAMGNASSRESVHSSDDSGLFVLDKLTRNTMLQDVLSFKKQLLQLRSVLQQPEEECLTRTDTLNPFEISNGQFFGTGYAGLDMSNSDMEAAANQSSSGDSTFSAMLANNRELYNLTSQSQEESKLELADLRRQVVYLQSQMDDKDRTIRYQQTLIEKLETEMDRGNGGAITPIIEQVDTTNTATQTERIRPVSMGGQDVSASTSESDELAQKTPAKSVRQNQPKATPPTLIKRQTISRLTSPLLSPASNSASSASSASTSKSSSNSTSPSPSLPLRKISLQLPAATATLAAINNSSSSSSSSSSNISSSCNNIDFQHSTPKVSPTASPRRIPRLMKLTNQSQAHSLTTDKSRANGGNNNNLHNNNHPKAAGNGNLCNPLEATLNHINQAQNYQKSTSNTTNNGHNSSNHHRTHINNIITNHANINHNNNNNNKHAENADNAKLKLHNNMQRSEMMRSPVFRKPIPAGDEDDF